MLSLKCISLCQNGEPLALLMRGVNLYTGGHFDEYDATFFDYKVRPLVDLCKAVLTLDCANLPSFVCLLVSSPFSPALVVESYVDASVCQRLPCSSLCSPCCETHQCA